MNVFQELYRTKSECVWHQRFFFSECHTRNLWMLPSINQVSCSPNYIKNQTQTKQDWLMRRINPLGQAVCVCLWEGGGKQRPLNPTRPRNDVFKLWQHSSTCFINITLEYQNIIINRDSTGSKNWGSFVARNEKMGVKMEFWGSFFSQTENQPFSSEWIISGKSWSFASYTECTTHHPWGSPTQGKFISINRNLKELGPFFFHFFQSYCDFGTIRIVIFFWSSFWNFTP